MCGIPADRLHAGAYNVTRVVDIGVSTPQSVALDVAPRGIPGLITDKQNIVPRLFEHRLEIVDDPSSRAHTARRDDNGGTPGSSEIVHRLQAFFVIADGGQLLEAQGVQARCKASSRLGFPIRTEFATGLGKARGQR